MIKNKSVAKFFGIGIILVFALTMITSEVWARAGGGRSGGFRGSPFLFRPPDHLTENFPVSREYPFALYRFYEQSINRQSFPAGAWPGPGRRFPGQYVVRRYGPPVGRRGLRRLRLRVSGNHFAHRLAIYRLSFYPGQKAEPTKPVQLCRLCFLFLSTTGNLFRTASEVGSGCRNRNRPYSIHGPELRSHGLQGLGPGPLL